MKIDDTTPGIGEGLNAGVWTVGLSKTGNEVGLTAEEIDALPPAVRERKLARADMNLRQAGAHYVVETIADVPAVIDDVNQRLRTGEAP